MKTVTPCLQASDIEALLAGTLPPSQSLSWEEHISGCASCRQTMANQVGDQQWWQEAERSLKHHVGESLRDSHVRLGETDLREADLHESCVELESIEELLKLLGPTDDPQMLGRIGSYEVLGVLGRGGMGVVFKAFDAPLNRFVAIKMLLPHLAASGAARKRFAREGQAVAAVVDDHVMAIHCVAEWQGVPYLVMTYSRGVSLQKRLTDNGPLEVREILRIGMQTAKGLAAAHAQGIVHRDIKPANIFLDQTVERVQLMDFGLARAVDDASLTRTGVLAGTPQYMSPEQARAESVDHRSDLFSLGSVMYAMCTGHAPFRAESSYSVLRLITDKEPRSIREINPDIPEWLCSLIKKLMAKQACDRYQSAKDVSDLLENCLAHVQQPTTKNLPRELTDHLVPQCNLPGRTDTLLEIQMPKKHKFYARFAVGLLATAFLGPIVIAAFADDFHAVLFFGFAMAIAVLFALISWRHRTSKYVVSAAGLTGCIIAANAFLLTYPMPWQLNDAEASFKAIAAEHEAAFERALTQRKYEHSGQVKEVSPPTKPLANGESDKAEQGVGTLMTDSNDKTLGEPILQNTVKQETKYFLTLKFYEKRKDSIKRLYSPTIAVVDGKPFECTNAGTIKESFSGYKVNGSIFRFQDDGTFLAKLQVVNYSGKFQAYANLPISETKTVQLDEVTWLDLRIEPERNDNTLKLSAKEVEVVSSQVSTEVRATESGTLTQPAEINISVPQMTGDVPASKTEDAEQLTDVSALQPSTTTKATVQPVQPLLETWEQVQDRVAEIVKEHEAIANAEVDFKLESDGKNTSKRHYHVWLNDRHRRADCRGVSGDAAEDYTHIVTPTFSWYDDQLDKSKLQLDLRDPKDPVGWGTLGCIVDVRKVGLVNWSIESIDTYEFDHDLLPKDRTETLVETGDDEGAPITIAKHRLKSTDATERWTEYWLSPAHGNYPIYIANGWTEPGNPTFKNIVSQRTQWDFLDGIWFPRSVKHHYLSEHRKLDETSTFTLIGARFNVLPFPNVFDLSKVDSRESNTNSR